MIAGPAWAAARRSDASVRRTEYRRRLMKKTLCLLLPALLLAGLGGAPAAAANRIVLCEEFGRTT